MFLTCKPQVDVEFYRIAADGIQEDVKPEPDGSLRYDLESFPPGEHTVQVSAGNKWMISPAASCTFTKPEPLSSPEELGLDGVSMKEESDPPIPSGSTVNSSPEAAQ